MIVDFHGDPAESRWLRRGVLLLALSLSLFARSEEPATPSPEKAVVPLAPLSGDFWSRPVLTGDWGGLRSDLANKGIQFDLGWTQTVQSIVSGGRDTGTAYISNLDLVTNIDLYRMGLVPGAFVKLRAESRFGKTVNGNAGTVLPVNTAGDFPLTSPLDDNIPIVLTDLTYYQFLSPKFGMFVGKFDTLDADPNEFASGRGVKQFLNANFLFSSILGLAAPYSTLGGGAVFLPTDTITISGSIYETSDSSTTSGFENTADGWSTALEADLQYRLGHLPGGVNLGGSYSWDNDFHKLGGRFTFKPGEGLAAPKKSDTWCVYISGWQYLLTADDVGPAPVKTGDGRPDYRGIGVFYRAGVADTKTNPIEWTASGGFGGRGLIPTRDQDTWGVGYYYARIQHERIFSLLRVSDNAQGFEAFYNIALAGWAHFTVDVQAVSSPFHGADTAVIVGGRLELRF
jgi:porin